MSKRRRLSAGDRAFFVLAAEAAFANPFSAERRALDVQIAGSVPATEDGAAVDAAIARVHERLRTLDARGVADIRNYAVEDRQALETAFLFDAFHQHLEAFDQLLQAQIRAGDESLPVSFAADALALLTRRGFAQEAASRYLALFYQLRRAYHFINGGLVGLSPCMETLRRRLWQNVFTRDIRLYEHYLWDRMEDFSTLLLGETGTGKGAAAAAVGRSGFIPFDARRGRFTESFMRGFVSLNLSQFQASLIESELFGHCKGAFTGAVETHAGAFARCSPHGAVFLDEIGEVSRSVQIKLLQVLQERRFTPVGSHEAQRFSGRVVAATNRSLEELRGGGTFREDFYYRLCSDTIAVPPLRQRLREEPRELDVLLRALTTRLIGREEPALARDVAAALRHQPGPAYAWPGNVRELEQATRRVLLTGSYEGGMPPAAAHATFLDAIAGGRLDAEQLLVCCLRNDYT